MCLMMFNQLNYINVATNDGVEYYNYDRPCVEEKYTVSQQVLLVGIQKRGGNIQEINTMHNEKSNSDEHYTTLMYKL